MIAAGMIAVGLALLLIASIPQTWAPLGRIVRSVNTALAPLAVRPFADLFKKTEDEVQDWLVKAARITLALLGVLLMTGAGTYAASG